MRTLAVANLSTLWSDEDCANFAAALQIQISRDFAPAWGIDAQVVVTKTPVAGQWPLWIIDSDTAVPDALAWHEDDKYDRPEGIVPVKDSLDAGVAFSPATPGHEALEMLADPLCNTGCFATFNGKATWLFQEICDPVENSEYPITLPSGVIVSMTNFVLPSWFVSPAAPGTTQFDHMGLLKAPLTLGAGGYVSYYQGGKWQQAFGEHTPDRQKKFSRVSRRARLHKALKRMNPRA